LFWFRNFKQLSPSLNIFAQGLLYPAANRAIRVEFLSAREQTLAFIHFFSNHAPHPLLPSHNIRKLIQKPLNPIIFRSFLSTSTAVNHTYSSPPTSNCTHREFEKDKKGETNPTNPSFANGPPTFSAVPPIAPSALNILPTAPSFEKAGVLVPSYFVRLGLRDW
jgi:hypothetical protein